MIDGKKCGYRWVRLSSFTKVASHTQFEYPKGEGKPNTVSGVQLAEAEKHAHLASFLSKIEEVYLIGWWKTTGDWQQSGLFHICQGLEQEASGKIVSDPHALYLVFEDGRRRKNSHMD